MAGKKKRLPDIDLEELARFKEKNFRQRLEFQDMYVEWLKKTGNVRWSSAQKSVVDKKPSISAVPAVRKNSFFLQDATRGSCPRLKARSWPQPHPAPDAPFLL